MDSAIGRKRKRATARDFLERLCRRFRFVALEYEAWNEGLVMCLPGDLGRASRRRFLCSRLAHLGGGALFAGNIQIMFKDKLSVGDNVSFNSDVFINAAGGVTIGDHTLIGPGSKIWSTNHRFTDADRLITEQGYDCMPVNIGADVWVAANVIILPGVTIGDGCVVAAGAVVTNDVPPYSIIAGVPARIISMRKPSANEPLE